MHAYHTQLINILHKQYHHWLLFPLFLLFCNTTVDECMEFIVHLFRNITLYKANYNTNTFWPRGISKRQLEHSLY